ncbi:hypothetical protein BOX15_Mlig000836g3, partial [Macrostomum lignano]
AHSAKSPMLSVLSRSRGARLLSLLASSGCQPIRPLALLAPLPGQLLCCRCFAAPAEPQGQPRSPPQQQPPPPPAEESRWTGKNSWKLSLVLFGAFVSVGAAGTLISFGQPEADESGRPVPDRFSDRPLPVAYLLRALANMRDFNRSIKDPISDKLLPDPAQPPYYQPPYTLVLEVTGILLHSEWSFRTGWRFKKRPGLDVFLQQVAPYFEVVVYTKDTMMNLDPVLKQVDPDRQFLHYRLYRESTRYRDGVHLKDLSCLNRDLSKVIFVDWDAKACQLQPRNCLAMRRWRGDDRDLELIDLAAFLRMLLAERVDDVRGVLEFYSGFEDPMAEFRLRQQQLVESQEAAKKRKAAATAGGGSGRKAGPLSGVGLSGLR